MSELDIVQVPGYPGKWARRCVVEAWITAGRPYVNWAGRTYEEQKRLWNLYNTIVNGKRLGNAADNPDANTRQPHVRGMALDLAGYDKGRMEAAGFVQPIWRRTGFSQDEPWHWELARYVDNIRSIPKVTAGQVASLDSKPFDPEEDDMTPEQATQLDAIYKALFGPNNGPKKSTEPLRWADIGGTAKNARYGALDIVIYNQQLIAQQAGKINGLADAVSQLQGGGQVNMGQVTAAAEAGARDALARLTISIED